MNLFFRTNITDSRKDLGKNIAPPCNLTENKGKHSPNSQGEDSQSQISQNVLTKPPNYNLNSVHPSIQRSKQ